MKSILVIFGTRPEAIKLAPFIISAKKDARFKVYVCSTGQHREMLKPILNFFDISPDFDLDIMKPGQSLADISLGVLGGLENILKNYKIDTVVVQGDTSSCFIGSLIAFYHKIPVVHVEAGLRSGDIYSPFPEEFNRRATGLIAKMHFAPTEVSRGNLLKEGIPSSDIFVTGNTGIDALLEVHKKLKGDPSQQREYAEQFSFLDASKKLILVTIHRRESFGPPMEEVMKALVALSQRADIEILMPLHLNPAVRESAQKIIRNHGAWVTKSVKPGDSKIWFCEPVDYVPFVYLMNRAHFIITDSGGIQEEAPSLGKPVLVAREKTERPEAITAGTSKLIPLEKSAFLKVAEEILDTPAIYKKMSEAKNPFGDGTACRQILDSMAKHL